MQSVCACLIVSLHQLLCHAPCSPRFSANLIFGQFKGSKIGGASSLPDLSASVKSGRDLQGQLSSQWIGMDQNSEYSRSALSRDTQRYSECTWAHSNNYTPWRIFHANQGQLRHHTPHVPHVKPKLLRRQDDQLPLRALGSFHQENSSRSSKLRKLAGFAFRCASSTSWKRAKTCWNMLGSC